MNSSSHSRFLLGISAAILTCVTWLARADAPPPPLAAAILDFETGDDLKGKGAEVAILLNAQVSTAAPEVMLVERTEIEKILGEQEFGLSGAVSPDTAAKVGILTGAQVLITGRLFNAGDKYFIVAKVISTETGRVYGESATFTDPSDLDKAVAELAPKIANDLRTHADVLTARVETTSARLERLKKLVEGKKLPTVSVDIAEQNLPLPIIDPAAETEMKLVLQQIGFEIVLPHARKRADVAIFGEAFSEPAMRRGNFVSCRSRIEIKAVRKPSGDLLLADKQAGIGIDIGENNAGKNALENAADKLLDRIVPKLAGD